MNEKMKELVDYLNARTAEYDLGNPTISDEEWDNKYFELIKMEKELGYSLPNSPTTIVSYEVVNSLEKVEHNHKMLSLAKTKNYDEAIEFISADNQKFITMIKLDGLTCSLRYINGRLVSAETRGNGHIGENILHNAKVIPSIPKNINYKDELIIDGEIICKKSDFKLVADEYKNCRNLASGSIRLLDSKECAKRKLTFVAWDVIFGFNELEYLSEKLNKAQSLGFEIVPFGDLHFIANICENGDYPIDGLVFKFDNIAYGRSLGETSHHFKNAIAYKFYDEEYETYLEDIEWTMGRTGVLTPVAVFKTIDIDGSDVSRASLHNVSVMEELLKKPYMGQKIWVSKRNMIIPQIEKAEQIDEDFLHYINIPEICPVCGGEIQIIDNDGVKILMCLNPFCEGKLINKLDHFCGKKGLDIKGLSKATLEKLIAWGWINNISDLMDLKNYRNEWIKKSGFGEKSVDKILEAIESAKITTLEMFISSLGIPLIGQTVSKELINHIPTYEEFRKLINERFDFSQFDGFAEEKTKALLNFNYTEADMIYKQLTIVSNNTTTVITNPTLNGYKFVITGKLNNFKNRNELKAVIESSGGKVVDSINKSVNFLINNDIQSASSKNVAAKKLNIPIISEKEFLESFDLTF